ncbi:MAG: hypothetical protein ACRD2U_13985 [Terriglobales bacterium]
MSAFFTRQRFGRPQVLAGFLLLAFVAQCLWLAGHRAQLREVNSYELFRVQEGLRQWRGDSVAGTPSMARTEAGTFPPPEIESNAGYDPNHSPLWYLILSAPLLGWHESPSTSAPRYWTWLVTLPFLSFGTLLGASLWYVARRLYGNAGGYIALLLYCFSPEIIRSSALWAAEPEMGAAWGAFGAIFTAIAVAHTLYAPREVVLWNWRRTVLLGLSLALAVGSQFSLLLVAPIALGFMLYLAPGRRAAAMAIWATAVAFALFLLVCSYNFNLAIFWQGLRHAGFARVTWRAFKMRGDYLQLLSRLGQCGPALVLAVPPSLVACLFWPRTRYFGNTAPLIIAGTFLLMSLGTPHYPGLGFQLMSAPFLMLFVAGIAADLLESTHRSLALACLWTLLAANAVWNLVELLGIRHG